jgi:hypothetical protein
MPIEILENIIALITPHYYDWFMDPKTWKPDRVYAPGAPPAESKGLRQFDKMTLIAFARRSRRLHAEYIRWHWLMSVRRRERL